MYREKRSKREAAASKKSLDKDSFGKTHPAVWEYLTSDRGKNGETLQTASFTIFADDGCLKICCTDKEAGQVCFWTADTWEGLWARVEEDLAIGAGDWRLDRKRKR